jgi:cytochrome c1
VKQHNLHPRRPVYFLPLLATLILSAVLSACGAPGQELAGAERIPAGDPERGWQALQEYGCHSCHHIPGVPGADSFVGPPLTAWADRLYIAGTLPNEPDYLIEWIRFPQAIEPGTAMPNMGVTEQAAQDIGAYLYTLHADETWLAAFFRYWRTSWQ